MRLMARSSSGRNWLADMGRAEAIRAVSGYAIVEFGDVKAIKAGGAGPEGPEGPVGPSVSDGVLKCALVQSSTLQQITDNLGGMTLASISTRQLRLTEPFAAACPFSIVANATQSANLIDVFESDASTNIFSVSPVGLVSIPITGSLKWSTVLELDSHEDGTDIWLDVSTGKGVRAPHFQIDDDGPRLTKGTSTIIELRNSADIGRGSIRGSFSIFNNVDSLGNNQTLNLNGQFRSTAGNLVKMAYGRMTHSSGHGVGVLITPESNDTGTANFTLCEMNLRGSLGGLGDHLILDLCLAGLSKMAVHSTGIIDYRGTMGDSSKNPTVIVPDDWVEIEIGGTTYYLPAYLA